MLGYSQGQFFKIKGLGIFSRKYFGAKITNSLNSFFFTLLQKKTLKLSTNEKLEKGSAFIPVYLSNRPEMQDQFNRVLMYCGYTPTTHLGLMETLNANAPLSTPAMVFSGVHDPFAFGAPDQVAVFTDVVHYESSEAGHHLPTRNDPEFQNTVNFLLDGY